MFQEVESESGTPVLIKFMRRYTVEMHRLLAEKMPRTVALCLSGGWKMVAIKWLPAEAWVTLDHMQKYASKIWEVLEPLWADKWVHGDIRHYNILVPTSGEIVFRLIDFGSSGKEK